MSGFGRKVLKMERGACWFLSEAVGEQHQGNLTCFPACCCCAGHEDTVVCHHSQQGFPGSQLPSAAKCHCRLSAGSVSLQLELDSPFVFTWQNFSRKIEKSPLVAQAIVSREWNPLPPFPSSPWWGRPKANGLRWGRPLEGKDPAPRRDGRAVLSQRARLYLCTAWLARRLLVAVHHVNVGAFDLQGPDAFP